MKRLTGQVLAMTVAAGALVTMSTGTASADHGLHFLALKAPSSVQSVFVSGVGYTNWSTTNDGASGTVGSYANPVGLDVCYSYTSYNSGRAFKTVGDGLNAYTNQAPGKQDMQVSNPRWTDGGRLTVTYPQSADCTNGALAKRIVNVPGDSLLYYWLSRK